MNFKEKRDNFAAKVVLRFNYAGDQEMCFKQGVEWAIQTLKGEMVQMNSQEFHNEKCSAASDQEGVGPKNGAFKGGAEWALRYLTDEFFKLAPADPDIKL